MSDLLTLEQQKFLLGLARETVVSRLTEDPPVTAATDDPVLCQKRGAFVTLKLGGELRGCIGYPLPHKPLAEAVADLAIAAATEDFRFEPIREDELEDLEIEISVLTLPRPVEDVREIVVGKHGIIVSKGSRKGLLLPQVPGEYGWDLETYLSHGCLKAGLPEDAWRKGAKIEVFEAQVFHED